MSKVFKPGIQRCGIGGFSLVEVLIALVIMSVGMLGIAGLYVHSMQAGRTSIFRHQAVTLAGDIADRIRANPRGGVAYMAAAADFNCVGGGVDCSPAEMAQNDILLWEQQAAGSLPNGAVNIVFNNGVVPNTYQITVSWDEAGQNPPPQYRLTIPVAGP
ncbi:MAG: type IV pilus modification protein PilV [Gammaproteobacteria bacterium]|nr:type IV pilus modification protein PilV [Gammaproteobacteria bacterium]MDH4253362.1 type IV pilus modification protein PilV [Gammaproteobacteria bacterium]MDH5310136.1 type IV pilus modification protein PilV [Gammaproteobacteria bacterium]